MRKSIHHPDLPVPWRVGAAVAVVAAAIPLVVHRGKKPVDTPVHAL
jgi:hypothetical protein